MGVMKNIHMLPTEENIIDSWLEKHGDPEVARQVAKEAEYLASEHETLEEAAEKYPYGGREGSQRAAFMQGAKWQAERMLKDMQEYAEFCVICDRKEKPLLPVEDWYAHFKK